MFNPLVDIIGKINIPERLQKKSQITIFFTFHKQIINEINEYDNKITRQQWEV